MNAPRRTMTEQEFRANDERIRSEWEKHFAKVARRIAKIKAAQEAAKRAA